GRVGLVEVAVGADQRLQRLHVCLGGGADRHRAVAQPSRSARSRTSFGVRCVCAWRSASFASNSASVEPPIASRIASFKRSVRRSGGKRFSAFVCLFGLRSPYQRRAQGEPGLPSRTAP